MSLGRYVASVSLRLTQRLSVCLSVSVKLAMNKLLTFKCDLILPSASLSLRTLTLLLGHTAIVSNVHVR